MREKVGQVAVGENLLPGRSNKDARGQDAQVAIQTRIQPDSGHAANSPEARDVGLESLRWLTGVQKSPHGHFRPIGSNGFYHRGQEPAQFDQQPLEAQLSDAVMSPTLRGCS